MYLPKSSTINNLYSNGELFFKSNNQPYKGYYYETYNQKYFVGRNPQESNQQIELIKPQNTINSTPSFEPQNFDNQFVDLRFSTINNINYSTLKNSPLSEVIFPIPSYIPLLTTQNYQTGEFIRYFAKKTNEEKYTEISLTTFNDLKTQNPKYLFSQYIQFSLPWRLTGEKEQVARTNKNIIELTERQNSLLFLGRFLKFNYLQFYKD